MHTAAWASFALMLADKAQHVLRESRKTPKAIKAANEKREITWASKSYDFYPGKTERLAILYNCANCKTRRDRA